MSAHFFQQALQNLPAFSLPCWARPRQKCPCGLGMPLISQTTNNFSASLEGNLPF